MEHDETKCLKIKFKVCYYKNILDHSYSLRIRKEQFGVICYFDNEIVKFENNERLFGNVSCPYNLRLIEHIINKSNS